MSRKNLYILIGLAAAVFALWHPLTRQVILFILPLGRGFDDFVELILIIALVWWGGSRWWINWNKTKAFRKIDRDKNTKVKQIAWVTIAFVLAWFYPGYLDAIGRFVLYGNNEVDSMYFIVFVVSCMLAVAGWNIISYLDRRSGK